VIPAIRAFIDRQHLDAELLSTTRPGEATDLARAAVAGGCRRVVAVGGDGTMNEIARALVGTPVALALVPCGSGNGLARHLGVPLRPEGALALLTDPSARTISIDSGTANGHPFFNVMGAGFDAEISRAFNQLDRRGLTGYLRTGAAVYARYRGETVAITDGDGRRVEMKAYVVVVANSDQYGNRARIAPGARVDDGLLDLVVVPPPGVVGALAMVARLFLGGFDRSSRVCRMRGARLVIERPAPGLIHTDGEHHETDAKVDITVLPGSLRFLVPATCLAGAGGSEAPTAPLAR
jgi:diacylglycerol kinase (ATP)